MPQASPGAIRHAKRFLELVSPTVPALGAAVIVCWQSPASAGPETQSCGEAHARRAGAGVIWPIHCTACSAPRGQPLMDHISRPLASCSSCVLPMEGSDKMRDHRRKLTLGVRSPGSKRPWELRLSGNPISSCPL